MGGLITTLRAGYSGLGAARAGVDLTGHNIANAKTEGFHRRRLLQSPRSPALPLPGGVVVDGVDRVEDHLLARQVERGESRFAFAEERERLLVRLESISAELGEGGLGAAVDTLFNGFARLSVAPESEALREEVLSAARNVAGTFNEGAAGLSAHQVSAEQTLTRTLTEVNDKAQKIADLNGEILQAEAAGNNAGDLRDVRDRLVSDLAQSIGARSFSDETGQVSVLVDSMPLVQEDVAASLQGTPSVAFDGYSRIDLVNGATRIDLTEGLGGRLGALVDLRDHVVPQVRTQVDSLAFDLTTALNAQHRLGFGLDGLNGRDLFTPPSGLPDAAATLTVNTALSPSGLAAASDAASLPGNNENALALAGLASAPIAGLGNRTASEEVSVLIASIGELTRNAKLEATVSGDQIAHLEGLQASTESVSLDEEMVNLVQYQRSYQASARVLSAVNEMLARLMEL